jgi:hypothetical protein
MRVVINIECSQIVLMRIDTSKVVFHEEGSEVSLKMTYYV